MAYTSFEELEIWKRGCGLSVDVYKVLERCKDYGLRNQMQRCAVSIPSNIAEESERDSKADYIRFLRIAKGSAAELQTQIYIARKVGVLAGETADALQAEAREIGAMTQGLIAYLLKS
jgi:four helix bundle protein